MRAAVERLLLRLAHDPRLHLGVGDARLTAFMLRLQSGDSALREALFPTRNGGRAGMQSLFDLRIGPAVGQSQNQTRTKHIARRQRARLRPLF
jgi:hypothetical protein